MNLIELIQEVDSMTLKELKRGKKFKRANFQKRKKVMKKNKAANNLYKEIKTSENFWMKNL